MRFVLFFIFFLFLSYGPVALYSFLVNREEQLTLIPKLIRLILFILPTAFISYYLCSITGLIKLEFMLVCLINIGMIFFFLPLNIFLISKAISVYIRDKKGKNLRWVCICAFEGQTALEQRK